MHDPSIRALAAKVRYVIDPDNPYPDRFTGHVRVTLSSGGVRETSQNHFRGGRDEPMSLAALEEKVIANCAHGGWTQGRAREALEGLRALRDAPRVDMSAWRA